LAWDPPSLLFHDNFGLFPLEQSGQGMALTGHLNLVLIFKTSGAVLQCSLHALTVSMAKTLPFTFSY